LCWHASCSRFPRAASSSNPTLFLEVNRVRRTALALAKAEAEPVDMLIVELAALFHDLTDGALAWDRRALGSPVSWRRPPLLALAKYATGEPLTTIELLRPFFSSPAALAVIPTPFAADGRDQASIVCRIVDATSWSKERKLRAKGAWEDGWREVCRELAVVQDADRLDAIGGFGARLPSTRGSRSSRRGWRTTPTRLCSVRFWSAGIMRCCAYSASVNRPLHLPKDDPREPETAIAHFDDKLFKIDEQAMKVCASGEQGNPAVIALIFFLSRLRPRLARNLPSVGRLPYVPARLVALLGRLLTLSPRLTDARVRRRGGGGVCSAG
jgi:uncharacterized protein